MASRKQKFAVNDLVVLNYQPDATVYRIKAIEGFRVMLVDRAFEGQGHAWTYMDISLLKRLSIGQLRALHENDVEADEAEERAARRNCGL